MVKKLVSIGLLIWLVSGFLASGYAQPRIPTNSNAEFPGEKEIKLDGIVNVLDYGRRVMELLMIPMLFKKL